MGSRGIADRVAIVGMGCTPFGEHWAKSADDLLVEAVGECLATTPAVALDDVDAFWLGTLGSGQSGLTLSKALGVDYKPVTRVENYCADRHLTHLECGARDLECCLHRSIVANAARGAV